MTRTAKNGKVDVIAARFEGKRLNAPNDVVVRRDGNVYFTDPAFGNQEDTRELDFNGVFRVTTRGQVEAIAKWKTRPNGLALSPNGRTLYVSDSDGQSIHAFDLDRAGAASNDRVVVSKIPGVPAGLRTDEMGNIYVAAKDVLVYSPQGELVRTIPDGGDSVQSRVRRSGFLHAIRDRADLGVPHPPGREGGGAVFPLNLFAQNPAEDILHIRCRASAR